MDDIELLRRYAADGSETAFFELVRRHLDFVYRAALRQTGGDAHRAEDVTQIVFTLLARKAASLTHHTSLAGWLYTTTHLTTLKSFRAERRRQLREQRAQAMHDLSSDDTPEANWARMRPVLDDAMQDLNSIDREAILLRFFSGLPFAEVGAKLSLREDAVRIRVTRALEKLHDLLVKRGIVSTAATMAALLANEAEAVAPAALAANVTGTALASAAGGGILAGSLGIAAILSVVTFGTAVYGFDASRRARMELDATNHELVVPLGQLYALEMRAQVAEQTRSELQAAVKASKKAAAAATAAWDPRAEGRKFLAAFPQARAMMMQAGMPGILTFYAPFMRSANLTPGQTEQFENLIASTWVNNLRIAPTQEPASLASEPTLDQLSQVLGSQVAQEFEAYQKSMRYPYQFMASAAAAAAMAGEALSDGQKDGIAQIIENNTGSYQRGSGVLGSVNYRAAVAAVDWDAAIAQIQAALPASQFRAIQGELQHVQYIGEYWRENLDGASSGKNNL